MSALPLLPADRVDAVVALDASGAALTGRTLIAEARSLARRLPASGHVLNLCTDRVRFARGFLAAVMRGQPSLLPPNHTPDTIARLRALFPYTYALTDAPVDVDVPALDLRTFDESMSDAADDVPIVDADRVVAFVFTSGSTGAPVAHPKRYGALGASVRAAAAQLGVAPSTAVVGTVPSQHMYGLESTVLIALFGPALATASRPFFPADIVDALERAPRPRMLVTTPFHLRALLEADVTPPRVDRVVCATAPLSRDLARRAEAAFQAPLHEIYGCTEAGQLASRRTVDDDAWTAFSGVRFAADGDGFVVRADPMPDLVPLADRLALESPHRFRLVGRTHDLVNIAGKRTSLAHLDHQLATIDGVRDGAFYVPDDAHPDDATIHRLAAFVVAPRRAPADVLHALRQRIDDVFLPRPLVLVDALPRNATGKLTRDALAGLWLAHAAISRTAGGAPISRSDGPKAARGMPNASDGARSARDAA